MLVVIDCAIVGVLYSANEYNCRRPESFSLIGNLKASPTRACSVGTVSDSLVSSGQYP